MYDLNDISVESDFKSIKFSEIKVDLTTPLESAFWWLSVLSIIAIVLAWIFSPGRELSPQAQGVMVVAGFCLVFFGSLYFNTDNFYIFDLESQQMLYHFKFFFYRKVEFVANFADVHAVTSSGKYHRDKDEEWYTYRVKCILNTGQNYYLSDETREDLEKQNRIAKKISTITGAEYVKGLPGCYAIEKKSGDKFSFSFYECSWLDLTKQSLLEVGLAITYIAILITIGRNGPEIVQLLKSIFG
ncbi:MAG: hypothetical protein KKB51_23320 [Candidatus Riflebacteria bacterium]|nr:hypothetical protein [Candidatus Riflebacteria bacterium]